MDLVDYIRRQKRWSQSTFGRTFRPLGLTAHIRKELLEIEAAPRDLEEWIDVIILAIDGAWRAGYTPEDIAAMLEHKQQKNQRRVFVIPEDPNQPIEHDRTRGDV